MGGCCALVAGTLRMVNDLADFVAGVLANTKRTRKRGHDTTEGSVGCPADATAKRIRPRAASKR